MVLEFEIVDSNIAIHERGPIPSSSCSIPATGVLGHTFWESTSDVEDEANDELSFLSAVVFTTSLVCNNFHKIVDNWIYNTILG